MRFQTKKEKGRKGMETAKYKRLIERMEVQANLTWKREEKLVKSFAPDTDKPLKILEIGSGPGVITRRLCDIYPNASIICLELDEDFVNYSKSVLPENLKGRVSILQGDITEAKLEENTYDIVYARLVLQHVHGVDVALQNIYRVLKPGGKVLITDVDEGLFGIIDPPIPELQYALGQHIKEQVIEGGDRFIGRKFWRMLKAANFTSVDFELLPVNSDEVGVEAFIPQVDYEEMATMIDNNLLVQEDIDKVKEAANKFLEADYPFVLTVLFFVVGTK